MNRELKKITDAAIKQLQRAKTGSPKELSKYKAIVREQQQVHTEMMSDSRKNY